MKLYSRDFSRKTKIVWILHDSLKLFSLDKVQIFKKSTSNITFFSSQSLCRKQKYYNNVTNKKVIQDNMRYLHQLLILLLMQNVISLPLSTLIVIIAQQTMKEYRLYKNFFVFCHRKEHGEFMPAQDIYRLNRISSKLYKVQQKLKQVQTARLFYE